MITTTPIKEQVQELVNFLNNQFYLNSIESGHSSCYQIDIVPGRKYFKIVAALIHDKNEQVLEQRNRQCYCFIDQEGNIFKSDSWTKPAKGVRATIEQVLSGETAADPYGSWLYLR